MVSITHPHEFRRNKVRIAGARRPWCGVHRGRGAEQPPPVPLDSGTTLQGYGLSDFQTFCSYARIPPYLILQHRLKALT
jgi:hypothetical protein